MPNQGDVALGDVVNLRQVRKTKARALKEEQAARNRVHYGTSKTERDAARLSVDRQDHVLDGKQRVDSGTETGSCRPNEDGETT